MTSALYTSVRVKRPGIVTRVSVSAGCFCCGIVVLKENTCKSVMSHVRERYGREAERNLSGIVRGILSKRNKKDHFLLLTHW